MSGTVLVTGATGFVGRQVLRTLANQGLPTRVVIRDGTEARLEALQGIDRVITTADLFTEDAQWWANVCDGIDTIIHAAWYAEPGKYLHSPKNMDCVLGTLYMARGAAMAGVRRVVGLGTCLEYDVRQGLLTVETPLNPSTPYAGAKAAAYTALASWLPTQGVEFAWCRLFYLYGEGENERRLVPYLRAKLEVGEPAELTSGNQIRDFLDVREAGRMIVSVALGARQGAVNICSGVPITVRDFAHTIAEELGKRDLVRFAASSQTALDPSCVVGVR
ncbi:MAG: NAD(P)-dependent oxidoreductase [Nitrospira sp.]|nr:NAD(P)-dependent oxidoreductase [Nitrospira sp.]MBH0197045.1 NAD(P)-dependent oxidoreductase [Nitrospira sp.]